MLNFSQCHLHASCSLCQCHLHSSLLFFNVTVIYMVLVMFTVFIFTVCVYTVLVFNKKLQQKIIPVRIAREWNVTEKSIFMLLIFLCVSAVLFISHSLFSYPLFSFRKCSCLLFPSPLSLSFFFSLSLAWDVNGLMTGDTHCKHCAATSHASFAPQVVGWCLHTCSLSI